MLEEFEHNNMYAYKAGKSKGSSTLLVLVLVWLAMLASNVEDMTSHETSKF
jgi:hypothetical protein